MTTCHEYEERFSDAYEEQLTESDRREFEGHLASCDSCRTAFDSFTAATAALQGLRVAPTTEAHVEEILVAVEGKPARPWWLGARPFISHAAALLVGLSIAFGAGLLGEPEVVTVREEVEVPVEVPVEVIREVPVDRIVEVVREVPVEVPVETFVERVVTETQYVDREVPAELQADVDRHLAALVEFGAAASDLAFAAALEAERRRAAELDAGTARDLEDYVDPRFLASETPRPRARLAASPVMVVRDGERVTIRTRGALDEVVPALIDMLGDPDPAVARTAERHLESLRQRLSGESDRVAVASSANDDSPGGLRGLLASRNRVNDTDERAPRTVWQDWWAEVGGGSTSPTGSF